MLTKEDLYCFTMVWSVAKYLEQGVNCRISGFHGILQVRSYKHVKTIADISASGKMCGTNADTKMVKMCLYILILSFIYLSSKIFIFKLSLIFFFLFSLPFSSFWLFLGYFQKCPISTAHSQLIICFCPCPLSPLH